MDPDCQLLFHPGKYNEDIRVYSFTGDAFESLLNPFSDGPQADTIMKWRKEGGWGGFGAIYRDTNDLVNLSEYKYLTLWVMPTEDSTKFIKAEYKNRYYIDHPKNVIGENRIYVDFPPNKWSKAKFDLDLALQFSNPADSNSYYMGNINFQPDGTNDDPTWIGNYYYFGPVYLESETGCINTSSDHYHTLPQRECFVLFNNTLQFIEPGIKNMSVYSIMGTKVLDINNPAGSISLPETHKGIYVIQVITGDNIKVTRKILIR